jgi:hypothetical protein
MSIRPERIAWDALGNHIRRPDVSHRTVAQVARWAQVARAPSHAGKPYSTARRLALRGSAPAPQRRRREREREPQRHEAGLEHAERPLGLVGKAAAGTSRLTWTAWVRFPPFPRRSLPALGWSGACRGGTWVGGASLRPLLGRSTRVSERTWFSEQQGSMSIASSARGERRGRARKPLSLSLSLSLPFPLSLPLVEARARKGGRKGLLAATTESGSEQLAQRAGNLLLSLSSSGYDRIHIVVRSAL